MGRTTSSRLGRTSFALIAALGLVMPLLGGSEGVRAERRQLGAVVSPIRLVPLTSEPISVSGLHGYYGTVELRAAPDGLVVVDRLSLERYLLGLAEVPLDWPAEAIKAQAIAARTYALYTLGRPRAGAAATYGFDICASVQCQVFAGADVVRSANGGRWAAGVSTTRGETIVYEGEPILARYHSTSGGSTLANPQAFPGEIGYPYLQAVPSRTESGSPLYRWQVRFTRRDLEEILSRAGIWQPQLGRIVQARSAPSSTGLHYPDVMIESRKAGIRRTAEELRDVLRDFAPASFPRKYPSPAGTSSGRLPETLPSNRVRVFTEGRWIVFAGRGWGHGVGMSQWGAHGMARQGASYQEILAHYYVGTSIARYPTDRPIEVGVAWGQGVIQVSGAFRIVDGRGREVVQRALGDWTFDFAGEGAVAIDPPRGFGLPLEVGIVRAPQRVEAGKPTHLTIALSRPARVRTVTDTGEGFREPGAVVKSAGRRKIPWFAPVEPGTYEVVVRASTGAVVKTSEAVMIEVEEFDFGREEAEGPDLDGGISPALVAGAIAVLVGAVGAVIYLGRIGS